MEIKRTELWQEYEKSLPSGKGCREKKRKVLDGDEDVVEVDNDAEQTKKKKVKTTAADTAILKAVSVDEGKEKEGTNANKKKEETTTSQETEADISRKAETNTSEDEEEKEEMKTCKDCVELAEMKKKNKKLKKEKKKLEVEIEELREIKKQNEELQEELDHFKSVSEAQALVKELKELVQCKKDSPSPSCSYESSVESDSLCSGSKDRHVDSRVMSPTCKIKPPKDGIKVDIGNGVMVSKTSLQALNAATKSSTIFARKLLLLVYDESELVNKSLTGKRSNAHKDKDVREGLEPIKIEAICDLTRRKFPSADMTAVKSSLSNKLKEITKKAEEAKAEEAKAAEKEKGQDEVGEKEQGPDDDLKDLLG